MLIVCSQVVESQLLGYFKVVRKLMFGRIAKFIGTAKLCYVYNGQVRPTTSAYFDARIPAYEVNIHVSGVAVTLYRILKVGVCALVN